MRHATAMMMAFLMLVLSSCTARVAAPVTSGFTCTVSVCYDEAEYRGILNVCEETGTVLTLSEPPTVAGLTMKLSDEQLTVSYGGMELKLEESQIPMGAAASLLGKVFRQAAGFAQQRPLNEVQGHLDGASYVLSFDSESGFPVRLSVPQYALEVTFSECRMVE